MRTTLPVDLEKVTAAVRSLFHSNDLPVGDARSDEVYALLSELLLSDPGEDRLFTLFGHWYLSRGDSARASSCYLEVLDRNPEDADAALGLAIAFGRSGADTRAFDWLAQVERSRGGLRDDFVARFPVSSPALRTRIEAVVPSMVGGSDSVDGDRLVKVLMSSVAGQRELLTQLAETVRVSFSKVRLKEKRPRAMFAFYGPRAVGKKTAARALARALWDEERVVFVRMAELTAVLAISGERSGWADEMGEPEWVRGFNRWGSLVMVVTGVHEVRDDEKALLARHLRKARLTNPWGKTFDISGSIIVFAFSMDDVAVATRSRAKKSDGDLAQSALGKELSQLVDEVFPFVFLSEREAREGLLGYWEREVMPRLRARGYMVELSPEAEKLMLKEGWSASDGLSRLKPLLEKKLLPLFDRQPQGAYVIETARSNFALARTDGRASH